MPVGIVESLEMIYVEQKQRNFGLVAFSAGEFLFEVCQKEASNIEPREAISDGLLKQSLFLNDKREVMPQGFNEAPFIGGGDLLSLAIGR